MCSPRRGHVPATIITPRSKALHGIACLRHGTSIPSHRQFASAVGITTVAGTRSWLQQLLSVAAIVAITAGHAFHMLRLVRLVLTFHTSTV